MTIVTVSDIHCPKCGAGEMHPNGKQLLIRARKIQDDSGYWWSQCLVCSGSYAADLTPQHDKHNTVMGWFWES